MISETQDGIDATSPASRASGIDFEWGFQSSRPRGTLSSARSRAGTFTIEFGGEQFGERHVTSSGEHGFDVAKIEG